MAIIASDSDVSAPPGRSRRWLAAGVLVVILSSGIVFRLAEYLHNRSLWLDEAALAQNVLHQSTVDLALGHLTDDQVAPAGFLLATKFIITLAGAGEKAWRLLPLLAGLGTLLWLGWCAWRQMKVLGALSAAALVAWSWPLVYYSNEFKQYSTDAFVAFAIFGLAQKWAGATLAPRRAWLIGLAGLGALALSQTAVFVLGAWVLREIIAARARREESRQWFYIGAAWAAFLVVQISLNYQHTFGNARLVNYPGGLFLRLWPFPALADAWQGGAVDFWLRATAGPTGGIWAILLLAGLWAGWRNHRPETQFIVITTALLALASLLQLYPLELRLELFLLPLLFWLVGRGVDWLAALAKGWAWPCVALGVILAAWPLWRAGVAEARAPAAREDLRPVLEMLAPQVRPGDVIVVFDYTRFAFDYYWPRLAHAEAPVCRVVIPEDVPVLPEDMAAKLAPALAGHPARVWLVVSHVELQNGADNLQLAEALLHQRYSSAGAFTPPAATAQGLVFYQP